MILRSIKYPPLRLLNSDKYPNIHSDIDRFLEKIEFKGECWIYTASLRPDGSGQFRILLDGEFKTISAHRFAFEIYIGDLDPDLCISHTCKNPACVNPDHLLQLSQREVILRGNTLPAANVIKTHCIHGHEFTEENTRWRGNHRACKTCERIRSKRRYMEKKRSQDGQNSRY